VGGIAEEEQGRFGYVRARIRNHRWYERILKSRDPLIISCGWRRFQTMVIYATEDRNGRYRFFKYTPSNEFCHAIFYGPIMSKGSGLLGIQSVDEPEQVGYRIAATGVVLSQDQTIEVMKKLKLIGEPTEVYRKTAFIKGMFNSELEVARFQGAAIQTVSGIRGMIKKAIREPVGAFRASFEDRIREKDVVFLRSWVKIPLPKFHVYLTDKLLPEGEKWLGMKTVGRLRYERNLTPEQKPDSGYHRHMKHEQTEQLFTPQEMVIPKKLQKMLPYRLKPKFPAERLRHCEEGEGDEAIRRYTAVVLEPHESRIEKTMEMLHTVREDQLEKTGQLMEKKRAKHKKELAEIDARRRKKMLATRKRICRKISKRDAKSQRRGRGGGKKDRMFEMTGA